MIAAGSLLGLSVGRSKEEEEGQDAVEQGPDGENPNERRGSFPVGKVNFIDIYPMSLTELVRAVGEHLYAD